MAYKIYKLTALGIAKLKKRGLYNDGDCLYFHINQGGSRAWVFRYRRNGKLRHMGLGPYPLNTLEDARNKARDCKKLLKDGKDPIEAKKREKAEEKVASITFETAAKEYIASHQLAWKNPKHYQQWNSTLTNYVFPFFGKSSIAEVDTSSVLRCLESIWQTKTETASRIRGRIESILDWAKTKGYRQGENPARWKAHLENLLPAKNKVSRVQHFPALPHDVMPEFFQRLKLCKGYGARALEFCILTATRSGEVRGALWAEIDLKNKVWVIPPERMKAGKEHRIPLSQAALAILQDLPNLEESAYVFPSSTKGTLSDMTLTTILRRLKYKATVHGFRSTFRDWAGETTPFPREVIEHALAHQLKDKAEAAYARGTLFDKRRALMEAWSAHCTDRPQKP